MVQIVQVVQPQPEADQPLAELLHAPFKAFTAPPALSEKQCTIPAG
jgi:hypothetical protein